MPAAHPRVTERTRRADENYGLNHGNSTLRKKGIRLSHVQMVEEAMRRGRSEARGDGEDHYSHRRVPAGSRKGTGGREKRLVYTRHWNPSEQRRTWREEEGFRRAPPKAFYQGREPSKDTLQPSEPRPQTPRSPKVCRGYLKDEFKGNCQYTYPPICRKFINGKCGHECRYAHPTGPAVFERHRHLLDIEREERGTLLKGKVQHTRVYECYR
ncbi:hypothetical protein K458DRAFT_404904 [Lentithecium fluviatile CBS 122367]|uniref:Uncharacterized protein n=1 Tax=Lentithecium fluviatile CBS 122367 TaxID=1168545 RepID=A0A6G1IZH4_9PLEO|nr:hypothetical protein K458DRAFT_404904 [Lentithecium fluviatile CBS 122367]